MIYLQLFLTFLEIGAVSFGGGYAMISLIRDKALMHGWLSDEALLNLIAVSESTPGPIAVNMATFVGATQGGLLGSLIATLGVVLPSFFVILLVCALLRNLLKYAGVRAVLSGIRPCVVALILATALTMLLSNLLGIQTLKSTPVVDFKGLLILIILFAAAPLLQRFAHKKPSPILMILLSAALGILFYM